VDPAPVNIRHELTSGGNTEKFIYLCLSRHYRPAGEATFACDARIYPMA